MKKILNTITLLISILALPAMADSATQESGLNTLAIQNAKKQLPAPPDGFSWQIYKNAAFLKPNKWIEHTKSYHEDGANNGVYANSPEEFSEDKKFVTGFSVYVLSDIKKTKQLNASLAGIMYVKTILDTHKKEDVLILSNRKIGDFELTYFRYKDDPEGLTPIIVHIFMMANAVTDTVDVFTFESPASTWDENWKKFGAPMLSKIQISPIMLDK